MTPQIAHKIFNVNRQYSIIVSFTLRSPILIDWVSTRFNDNSEMPQFFCSTVYTELVIMARSCGRPEGHCSSSLLISYSQQCEC